MTTIRIFNDLHLTIFENYFTSPEDKTHPGDYNILKLQTLLPHFKQWEAKSTDEYAISFKNDDKIDTLKVYIHKILNDLQSPITIERQCKTLLLKNVNEENLLTLMSQKKFFVVLKNPDSMASKDVKVYPSHEKMRDFNAQIAKS